MRVMTYPSLRYNIRMNKWESVCSMHSHRSYAVAGVVGGEIIVVGGYNGSINLATVEKYNPVSDSWSMLSMLGSPRRSVRIILQFNQLSNIIKLSLMTPIND